MLCQATRTAPADVELPSQSPDGPYRLSTPAADRLRNYALRPIEWFNLAVIHGPLEFYLHDDFYDDDGNAVQSRYPVIDADLYPSPTLAQSSKNLSDLIDFANTRWHLTPPVIAELECYAPQALSAISVRFEQTRNWWFRNRLAEIAAAVLGQKASRWFRSVLDANPGNELALLRLAHQCLPREEGLQRAIQSLTSVPRNELARWCLVLGHFQDPLVLDWIEKNVSEPLTTQWGHLAALSELDWDRVVDWLERGRPFNLIALDALVACAGDGRGSSFIVQRLRPYLRGDFSDSVVEKTLLRHAQTDPSPRVQKAVIYILRNIKSIRG